MIASQGQQLIFPQNFIIIIVNDMKTIKLRLTEYIVCVRTSLASQRVKNLPTIRETWVKFLGWGESLVKEMATHSNILA